MQGVPFSSSALSKIWLSIQLTHESLAELPSAAYLQVSQRLSSESPLSTGLGFSDFRVKHPGQMFYKAGGELQKEGSGGTRVLHKSRCSCSPPQRGTCVNKYVQRLTSALVISLILLILQERVMPGKVVVGTYPKLSPDFLLRTRSLRHQALPGEKTSIQEGTISLAGHLLLKPWSRSCFQTDVCQSINYI